MNGESNDPYQGWEWVGSFLGQRRYLTNELGGLGFSAHTKEKVGIVVGFAFDW